MNFLQAVILGIVQGITEFLPISSSAHLVITPLIFNWQIPEEQIFPFAVLVQVGTLAAVIIYFFKDLLKIIAAIFSGLKARAPFTDPDARLGWLIVLASIPAGLAGLLLKDTVEAAFKNPLAVAGFLVITALWLYGAERYSKRSRELSSIGWLDAVIIGFAQVLALFPGISRSGATISAGMTRHLDRPAAARFSFLMTIPIMSAAGLIGVLDLLTTPDLAAFLPILITGVLTAALVGFASIHWLLKFLARSPLTPFSIYCLAAAALTIVVYYVR